jgi:hypothetical protein
MVLSPNKLVHLFCSMYALIRIVRLQTKGQGVCFFCTHCYYDVQFPSDVALKDFSTSTIRASYKFFSHVYILLSAVKGFTLTLLY